MFNPAQDQDWASRTPEVPVDLADSITDQLTRPKYDHTPMLGCMLVIYLGFAAVAAIVIYQVLANLLHVF